MSFFGKLLIVFQVVLSFCFMAFAGAVYTAQLNWKSKAEASSKQVEDARSQANVEKTQLNATISELQNQKAALESRAVTAETDLADTNTRLVQLETQMRDEQTKKTAAVELSTLAQREAEARKEEAYLQRDVNEKQHETQEELIAKLRAAEDKIFEMTKEREDLERKHLAALEEIATWKQIASKNNWVKDISAFAKSQAPPPEVRGYVTGTRSANDRGTETLVEISLGERDGLVPGHELQVYRPAARNNGRGMYLGKIRLVNVTPDRAVGMVVQRAKNGIIEKDDHVTTQL